MDENKYIKALMIILDGMEKDNAIRIEEGIGMIEYLLAGQPITDDERNIAKNLLQELQP